jgi:hypothetical protein
MGARIDLPCSFAVAGKECNALLICLVLTVHNRKSDDINDEDYDTSEGTTCDNEPPGF